MSEQCMRCFSAYLGKATAVAKAALPCPNNVYAVLILIWVRLYTAAARAELPCFNTYLGQVTEAARAALPCPNNVCDVLILTWVRLYTAAARAELPSSTCVCDVLMFTWVRLQQPQEQSYPVLPVYVMF